MQWKKFGKKYDRDIYNLNRHDIFEKNNYTLTWSNDQFKKLILKVFVDRIIRLRHLQFEWKKLCRSSVFQALSFSLRIGLVRLNLCFHSIVQVHPINTTCEAIHCTTSWSPPRFQQPTICCFKTCVKQTHNRSKSACNWIDPKPILNDFEINSFLRRVPSYKLNNNSIFNLFNRFNIFDYI